MPSTPFGLQRLQAQSKLPGILGSTCYIVVRTATGRGGWRREAGYVETDVVTISDWYASATFWAAAGVIVTVLTGSALAVISYVAAFPRRRLLYSMPLVSPMTAKSGGSQGDIELLQGGTKLAEPHILPQGARGCLQDCREWLPLWLPPWRFGHPAAAQSMPGFRRSVMIRRASRPPRLDHAGPRTPRVWWRASNGRTRPLSKLACRRPSGSCPAMAEARQHAHHRE